MSAIIGFILGLIVGAVLGCVTMYAVLAILGVQKFKKERDALDLD